MSIAQLSFHHREPNLDGDNFGIGTWVIGICVTPHLFFHLHTSCDTGKKPEVMKFECDNRSFLIAELLRLKASASGKGKSKFASEKITRGDRRNNCLLEVGESGLVERCPETDAINAVYEYRNATK